MHIYTIIGSEIGYIGGNYKNDKPLLAANKAGKALFKKLEDVKYVKYKNKKSIKFVLKNKKDKINYCYEVLKKKNKKEFNYEIKECVLSKNQLKKYIGGVGSLAPSSDASLANTPVDLGNSVRDYSPSTISNPNSNPIVDPLLAEAAAHYGINNDDTLFNVDPTQDIPQSLLEGPPGSDPPILEVGDNYSEISSQRDSSEPPSEPPSEVQSRERTPVNNDIPSPQNLSPRNSVASFPTSSDASSKRRRNSNDDKSDNDDNDDKGAKSMKSGGNKIIKLLLSALPILQQNEIRTKYNIPKSHNSVDIILKNYNLKYKEETRRSTKNSIYYNIKIKDGKSKKYEPYSDKLDSKYFKLDISKK